MPLKHLTGNCQRRFWHNMVATKNETDSQFTQISFTLHLWYTISKKEGYLQVLSVWTWIKKHRAEMCFHYQNVWFHLKNTNNSTIKWNLNINKAQLVVCFTLIASITMHQEVMVVWHGVHQKSKFSIFPVINSSQSYKECRSALFSDWSKQCDFLTNFIKIC